MKEKFKVKNEYDSHLPALYLALENTFGGVIELGSGEGSTNLLSEYCKEKKKLFISFENNKEFITQSSEFTEDYIESVYKIISRTLIGLLFIDSAPGEQRKVIAETFANDVECMVIHDTEDISYSGYDIQETLRSFKYRRDFIIEGYPQTTIVSNKIDVSLWK